MLMLKNTQPRMMMLPSTNWKVTKRAIWHDIPNYLLLRIMLKFGYYKNDSRHGLRKIFLEFAKTENWKVYGYKVNTYAVDLLNGHYRYVIKYHDPNRSRDIKVYGILPYNHYNFLRKHSIYGGKLLDTYE